MRCIRHPLGYAFCNIYITNHLYVDLDSGMRSMRRPRRVQPLLPGNLPARPVSNAVRTRATSHPCERGADFLENQSNPWEIGAAKRCLTVLRPRRVDKGRRDPGAVNGTCDRKAVDTRSNLRGG